MEIDKIKAVPISDGHGGAVMPQVNAEASGLQRLMSALTPPGFNNAALQEAGIENWLRVFRWTWR
jgi:microsomal dipeptidase-like Zn-dependent dipeptidase